MCKVPVENSFLPKIKNLKNFYINFKKFNIFMHTCVSTR